MIVCQNCQHQNPDGAVNCEACYTDLPSLTTCPHCGVSILSNAVFCGSCGKSLQPLEVELSANNALEIGQSEPISVINEVTPLLVDPIATATVLQTSKTAKLVHVQTNTIMEIPNSISIINIGKANPQLPPDIDVSGFPNSEIVSRVHARLVVENNEFYLEDLGSSNGTYINHLPLLKGDRHQLKIGDQISLGKEDKVTFIFQLVSG